jgi:uncharacterized coiled-coil protein SlyX
MIMLDYLKGLWFALLGRAEVIEREVITYIETDASALRHRIDSLKLAATIMELGMAFQDLINELDKEVTEALAAKDTANSANATALVTANQTITDLNAQLATQEQQLQDLVTKYAPSAPTA